MYPLHLSITYTSPKPFKHTPSLMERSSTNIVSPSPIRLDNPCFHHKPSIPPQYVWPMADRADYAVAELNEPVVDLLGFRHGYPEATARAAKAVRSACLAHGFFQVTNHGVSSELITSARDFIEDFFKLPLPHKLRAHRRPGSMWGYAGGHADRFSSKLPWKETFSFGYRGDASSNSSVVDYFTSTLGPDYEQAGLIYQRYCKAMTELSMEVMELLAISLGVEDRLHYRRFFQESSSIMRCNFYPPCQEPGRTFGTGPHCDPTSLTILHQDLVHGLEVLTNNRWYSVRPIRDAMVINIGDTFMALSNGRYKSCLHRAVVNSQKERISLAFFLCPREDKIVKPPQDLLGRDAPQKYPDFTWSQLLEFTQKHYRADMNTLQTFTDWLMSPTSSPN